MFKDVGVVFDLVKGTAGIESSRPFSTPLDRMQEYLRHPQVRRHRRQQAGGQIFGRERSPKTPMASENTATHADAEGFPLLQATESGAPAASTTSLLIKDSSAIVQPRL